MTPLPGVPGVPGVPRVPSVPGVPGVPRVPEVPGDHVQPATGSFGPFEEQGLRIRTARVADLGDLVRLDEEAFPAAPYPFFVLRQLLTAFQGFLLLVEDGGEPRGRELRGYVLVTPPLHGESWVLSLGIVPDLRGQGLGRWLMTRVIRLLRDEGTQALWLSVEPGNDTAVALYHSLGFVPDPSHPVKDYFGPGQHRLLMRLTL